MVHWGEQKGRDFASLSQALHHSTTVTGLEKQQMNINDFRAYHN